MSQEFCALFKAARSGQSDALNRLLPVVYEELRRLAHGQMRRERSDHTLQPTAVVHEAYLRLVSGAAPDIESRAHFLALAARTIRRVLIDYADLRATEKRGGDLVRVTLGAASGVAASADDVDVHALNDAIERLRALDPRAADVVELHYFGGMTYEEMATVTQLSVPTLKREWASARLWLRRELAA